ncbi:hypothetical protein ACLQ3C_20815 [Gordonia sp. DT30]|uniref:hypothetical protein n=1 Tax=Gordonia sp. DT30 TaxID=3416546 RepID=UPI003CF00752
MSKEPNVLKQGAQVRRSYCRACYNACDLDVVVLNEHVESIKGHGDNAVYDGYTCLKGRVQGVLLQDPRRLLNS